MPLRPSRSQSTPRPVPAQGVARPSGAKDLLINGTWYTYPTTTTTTTAPTTTTTVAPTTVAPTTGAPTTTVAPTTAAP
jgi:hypothetical protein